jgi:hypothetical protein
MLPKDKMMMGCTAEAELSDDRRKWETGSELMLT